MKWFERSVLFILLAGILMAPQTSQVNTYVNGQVLTANQLNAEFGNIYSTINGLDEDNFLPTTSFSPANISATIAGQGLDRTIAGVLSVNGIISDGTASAPGLRFASDTNTGLYRIGADNVAFSTGGTLRWDIDTGDIVFTLPERGPSGSAASPTYSFSTDTDSGMFRDAADQVGFSAGGSKVMEISASGVVLTQTAARFVAPSGNLSTSSVPDFSWSGDSNTGMFKNSDDTISFTTGGDLKASFTNAGGSGVYRLDMASTNSALLSGVQLGSIRAVSSDADSGGVASEIRTVSNTATGSSMRMEFHLASSGSSAARATLDQMGDLSVDGHHYPSDGSAGAPAFSFSSDTDTGVYRSAANTLNFSTGGTSRVAIDSSGNVTLSASGSAADPLLAIAGDTNTGLFSAGADTIAFTTAGDQAARFTSAQNFIVEESVGANGTSPTAYFHVSSAALTSTTPGLRIQDTNTLAGVSDIMSDFDFSGDTDVTGAFFLRFQDGSGTIGSITAASSTSVAYNTTSDARLKKDGTLITGAIARVKAMLPKVFKWVEDDHEDEGFYAQELVNQVPHAVSGDPNGDVTTNPMQVDYSKLTPVLTAALKETIARLEALETEFQAYKAAHP